MFSADFKSYLWISCGIWIFQIHASKSVDEIQGNIQSTIFTAELVMGKIVDFVLQSWKFADMFPPTVIISVDGFVPVISLYD